MTVYINGQGHKTKMAAMAINSKKTFKIFFSRNRRPMILKLGMKQQGEELYKVYINHDLGMTLTYFIYQFSGERLQDHWSSCFKNPISGSCDV